MQQSNLLPCTYVQKMSRGRRRELKSFHDPKCSKHKLLKQAQSLEIDCYEWPLPETDSSAKAVVFELEIPDLLRSWRSTTYSILTDVLNPSPPSRNKAQPENLLVNYAGLATYIKSIGGYRLQLASSSPPLLKTQHASQNVSDATEDSVCRPNNLKFFMQDSRSQRVAKDHLGKYEIQERCTLNLPTGTYDTLQYAVTNTTHTSNEIISNQGTCPDGLNIHEFHAFAALRSGHRLQVCLSS